MHTHRKKPEFGKVNPEFGKVNNGNSLPAHSKSDDARFCLWAPLSIVVSYFVLSAIVRVTSNSGSKLDQIICYGALICFVILMLPGARDSYRKSKARKIEKERWIKGCKTPLLKIVSRREAKSWWDNYDGRFHGWPDSLDLEMNSDQKAVSPNQTIVKVEVSQYVYERLKERNTVRVYYMPESPLTFLLEEEL